MQSKKEFSNKMYILALGLVIFVLIISSMAFQPNKLDGKVIYQKFTRCGCPPTNKEGARLAAEQCTTASSQGKSYCIGICHYFFGEDSTCSYGYHPKYRPAPGSIDPYNARLTRIYDITSERANERLRSSMREQSSD